MILSILVALLRKIVPITMVMDGPLLKRNVEKRKPKNLSELEKFSVEEWNNIPDSLLISLVDSMKQRCREVIERRGERIILIHSNKNLLLFKLQNDILYVSISLLVVKQLSFFYTLR